MARTCEKWDQNIMIDVDACHTLQLPAYMYTYWVFCSNPRLHMCYTASPPAVPSWRDGPSGRGWTTLRYTIADMSAGKEPNSEGEIAK
ncbi:hypothetical protein VPNG_10254 [Cytospora leucostoma]|uniref:Uncharacterized protein n=1 Tax=Cytospora leucostoma TaxID=1230097 RepID=A0A423VG55_9PEZI|nr:hypothetical protein VPNG_10254 [Cytospora leucostoma]